MMMKKLCPCVLCFQNMVPKMSPNRRNFDETKYVFFDKK